MKMKTCMAAIWRRRLRWALLLAAAPTVWACNARPLAAPAPRLDFETNDIYEHPIDRKLDIVFMIDDSTSMTPLQNKLTASFPSFMHVLESLPGGLPDVHIGVVSSSMGAGRNPGVAQCPTGGDRGVFQNRAVGTTCAAGSLNAGQRFISNIGGVANYTGDISDVFGCIAALGDAGCGFEHQFASVLRALGADGQPPPSENAGFLRDDAALAIVLITNEDDCSAPHNTTLFDQTSQLVSDPFGPLQSYRCNEYGHLCLYDGKLQAPPRQPDGEVTLSGCVSNEKGPLDPVADFVTFLKGLKGDPARVFLAAVTGPATPYVVGLTAPTLQDASQWPIIEHSCQDADGTYADPSVRIAQAVNAFGGHGLLASICDDTMGPVLQKISTQLSRPMAAPCVPTPDPSGPGCTVVDRSVADDGTIAAARVPSCDVANGATPCWTLVADATCGAGSEHLKVSRGGATVPATLVTAIDCSAPHP